MKAISFAQRLLRDLKEKDLASLSADTKLELVDSINGGLGKMHALAPPHTKIGTTGLVLAAPTDAVLTLTKGSQEFTGYTPAAIDHHCTIRIDGDGADNQITEEGKLLFPYSGEDGSHAAVIYHDSLLLPEPIEEIIEDPLNIDTLEKIVQDAVEEYRQRSSFRHRERRVARPTRWRVEENGLNQSSGAPALFRVDTLPPEQVRMQVQISKGPVRVSFQSLLAGTATIPMRHEHIETYLLPVCRAILSDSSMWRHPETRDSVRRAGEKAERQYEVLAPSTQGTPSNRIFTPNNF